VGLVIGGLSISFSRVQAQDTEATLSQIGLAIAPVPLNLIGKDQQMVGLGSYLVNAIGDCNGCHTGGGPPNFNYAVGGNPYFLSTNFFLRVPLPVIHKVDPTVYLSGGQDFGPVGTPTGPSMYPGPDMIARNLTPDKNGLPEGGMTLAQFTQILRTGSDFDHVHPVCTAAQLATIAAGTTPPPICIPTSPDNNTNGDVLQIMPWPAFSHLTDYNIQAIYAYLSAIPCIDNSSSPAPAGAPDELRNDCGTSTTPVPHLRVGEPLRRWRR
jgi:hypothetical protein